MVTQLKLLSFSIYQKFLLNFFNSRIFSISYTFPIFVFSKGIIYSVSGQLKVLHILLVVKRGPCLVSAIKSSFPIGSGIILANGSQFVLKGEICVCDILKIEQNFNLAYPQGYVKWPQCTQKKTVSIDRQVEHKRKDKNLL